MYRCATDEAMTAPMKAATQAPATTIDVDFAADPWTADATHNKYSTPYLGAFLFLFFLFPILSLILVFVRLMMALG